MPVNFQQQTFPEDWDSSSTTKADGVIPASGSKSQPTTNKTVARVRATTGTGTAKRTVAPTSSLVNPAASASAPVTKGSSVSIQRQRQQRSTEPTATPVAGTDTVAKTRSARTTPAASTKRNTNTKPTPAPTAASYPPTRSNRPTFAAPTPPLPLGRSRSEFRLGQGVWYWGKRAEVVALQWQPSARSKQQQAANGRRASDNGSPLPAPAPAATTQGHWLYQVRFDPTDARYKPYDHGLRVTRADGWLRPTNWYNNFGVLVVERHRLFWQYLLQQVIAQVIIGWLVNGRTLSWLNILVALGLVGLHLWLHKEDTFYLALYDQTKRDYFQCLEVAWQDRRWIKKLAAQGVQLQHTRDQQCVPYVVTPQGRYITLTADQALYWWDVMEALKYKHK